MLPLGHLGIGSRLLGRLRNRLDARWLYAGCLLPDLIDKPLYYALSLSTGRHGAALGLISGTRTFGHTGLLLLVLGLLALLSRGRAGAASAALAALALGDTTHLILDNLGDLLSPPPPERLTAIALFFPAMGVRFPIAHFANFAEHLQSNLDNAFTIAGELVGGAILLAAWLRARRQSS